MICPSSSVVGRDKTGPRQLVQHRGVVTMGMTYAPHLLWKQDHVHWAPLPWAPEF
jgi:hypothetical protein